MCVCVRSWPFAEALNVKTAHIFYIITVCAYGFGLCREVWVKTEKIWSGPGTRTQTILHIFSNWPLSNLMYSKWCLKNAQQKCAQCLVVLLLSQHLQPIRVTPSASHLQLIFHPSKRIFLPLPLCLSSLKPSLSHSLSIMLLSCSDSALFFHFFLLFLSLTLITLPVAEDDVCRLVILTLIC